MLLAGSIIFLALTGIVIFILLFYQKKRFSHRYQLEQMKNEMERELLRTQLETQENTFRQIADELHDNVGQLLSSANILLVVTRKKLPDPPDTLLIASETLSKAMQDLRALSRSLNKEWLQRFNLIDNLQAEADRINISRAILVRIIPGTDQLPATAEAQVMLFRIIQEAIQNCIRHAGARSIDVHITMDEASIKICVHDDGKGFTPDPNRPQGLGLLNMRHRTSLLGGSISWESVAGEGTKVQICLPIQKHEI
jgi:signal transduction histidine kinase